MPTRVIIAFALIGVLVALAVFLLARARTKARLRRRGSVGAFEINLKD